MHRISFSLAALLLGGAQIVSAAEPSAADLVAKNLAARGGAEKLAALNAVRFDGKMILPGDFQLTYQETRARRQGGDQVRVDSALQGLTLVSAHDGTSGWRINPFEGRRDAERMSDDEARSLADSARLDGALLAARGGGATVSYLGREDFDGTLAYKLKVSEKDGDEFVYLLDPDSMLEIKVTETRRVRGAPQVFETELGDYEPVGGVMFPMSVESWAQGQANQRQRTIIASATANPPVTPMLFAMPASPAAAQAGVGTSGQADAAQSEVKPPNAPEPPASPAPSASPTR